MNTDVVRPMLMGLRLVYRVFRRFFGEHMVLMTSALAFDTLLGLVPMIAVALSLPAHVLALEEILVVFQNFVIANFLPDSSGPLVAYYLGQFARRAENVPMIGAIALVIIALAQMLTIEHAFNVIWRVRRGRPFVKRLMVHALTLFVGPLVFGGSIALVTLVGSVSLGFVAEPVWVTKTFYRLLPSLFMAILFAALYWAVPYRRVSPWHALVGGVFAATGFVALQHVFGLYVANFPFYAMVYGAFSAIPIFLAWLFFSWGIVLVGALIVAELPTWREVD